MSPFHFTRAPAKPRRSCLAFPQRRHFKDATLSLTRSVAGKRQDYLVWKLSEVLVRAATTRPAGRRGEELSTDGFDLAFAKIDVEFQPFDPRRPG